MTDSHPQKTSLGGAHDMSGANTLTMRPPGRAPSSFALSLLVSPLNNDRVFAFLFCLSFVPFVRFNYTLASTVWDSLIQGIPQLLLIALSVLFASFQLTFRSNAIMAFGAAICIAASQACGVVHSPASQKNFVTPATFALLLLLGPIFTSFSVKIDAPSRGEYIAQIGKIVLALLSLECVLRYAFSPYIRSQEIIDQYGITVIHEDWFYQYKQSLMFSDSNAVGIALLCLIAVMLVYRRHFRGRHLILAYCLVLATISRASIIAAVFQYAIYKFWRRRRLLVGGLIFSSPLIVYYLLRSYINGDPNLNSLADRSFLSKLYMLQSMIDIFQRADIAQHLFGIGSGNTQYLAGMAAHNIIVVFVLELGVVGSAALIAYVWFLARKSPVAFSLLIVPLVINGFSLFLTTSPFMYVTLGFLGTVTTKELYMPLPGGPAPPTRNSRRTLP
jgi:hypothetical protein